MPQHSIKFEVLFDTFGICKLNASQAIPQWAYQGHFCSVTKTTDELSIVCTETSIPAGVLCEKAWRAFKITGILDFSLVGILSAVSAALAKAGVSLFAISTYNTDYILVKAGDFDVALQALRHEGYEIVDS